MIVTCQCQSGHVKASDDPLCAQENAEMAVRDMLRRFSTEHGLPEVGTVTAEDCMDDGTPIRLAVTIDRRDGSAVFDFAGGGLCPAWRTHLAQRSTESAFCLQNC